MSQERDLVLPANEYALILDRTKGHISVHTGPTKQSLSQTDQPVFFNRNKRFQDCELKDSIQPFCLVQQGCYVELENPSAESGKDHPPTGTAPATPNLYHGRKVNISGPISFALWPGQTANVIKGHTLASNQYLLVRVYDDKAAKEHLEKAIIKTESSETAETEADGEKLHHKTKKELISPTQLSIGKLIVIKGTEANFFIPSTGLEVVPDEDGNYVREAVSLERLEYCLLLDQNGNKRYVRGPDVVFPAPTEEFVSEDGLRKFRAIELNPNCGIHVKVIADYEDGDKKYKTGEELFITGDDTKIYFPKEEHAIIRSGDQQIHHGVTLPRGEARYVLDKERGVIDTIKGPQIFLPDPRKQIIVKRILTENQCSLMYPNNSEALQYNRSLASQLRTQQQVAEKLHEARVIRSRGRSRDRLSKGLEASYSAMSRDAEPVAAMNYLATSGIVSPAAAAFDAASSVVGDTFDADSGYQKPHSITIDNKYDGAVSISPWTGYAVMVKDKEGKREVVMGPNTRILEYDEDLDVLALSTGRPKSDGHLKKTVYLQVENNRVSDIIDVETSDFTKAQVTVSFRVNFVGDNQKWFNVANYTKLLSEHMRSKIRRAVMQHGIEHFYRNSADIIRNTVLGVVSDEGKKRPGFLFQENNMQIYDVEVLDVSLNDNKIQQILAEVQREGINHTIQRERLRREVEHARAVESSRREQNEILAQTEILKCEIRRKGIASERLVEQSRYESERAAQEELIEILQLKNQANVLELEKTSAQYQQELGVKAKEQELTIQLIKAETDAVKQKAEAVNPHLIKALQGLGDSIKIERISSALSPFGMIDMLRGRSVVETFQRLLRGSNLDVNFVHDEPQLSEKTGTQR